MRTLFPISGVLIHIQGSDKKPKNCLNPTPILPKSIATKAATFAVVELPGEKRGGGFVMRVFLGNSPWKKPGFYGVRAGSRWPHFEEEHHEYMPFPFFLAYAFKLIPRLFIIPI